MHASTRKFWGDFSSIHIALLHLLESLEYEQCGVLARILWVRLRFGQSKRNIRNGSTWAQFPRGSNGGMGTSRSQLNCFLMIVYFQTNRLNRYSIGIFWLAYLSVLNEKIPWRIYYFINFIFKQRKSFVCLSINVNSSAPESVRELRGEYPRKQILWWMII